MEMEGKRPNCALRWKSATCVGKSLSYKGMLKYGEYLQVVSGKWGLCSVVWERIARAQSRESVREKLRTVLDLRRACFASALEQMVPWGNKE
jgi:hypothetical protein